MNDDGLLEKSLNDNSLDCTILERLKTTESAVVAGRARIGADESLSSALAWGALVIFVGCGLPGVLCLYSMWSEPKANGETRKELYEDIKGRVDELIEEKKYGDAKCIVNSLLESKGVTLHRSKFGGLFGGETSTVKKLRGLLKTIELKESEQRPSSASEESDKTGGVVEVTKLAARE